jgi:Ca-activated chloride channel family protein
LLLLIPLALAAWCAYRRRQMQALVFTGGDRLPAMRLTWRTVLLPAVSGLILAGLALAILALARPQTFFSRTLRQTEGLAIQMVVDCSGSMEALDFSTSDKMKSRLDVVKETFARFIERRSGDLIGLITFGGYATSRAPLTIDHAALLHTLRGVEVPKIVFDAKGQMLNQEETMTAIGDALATTCARLERAPFKSRILVLLSDGESNTGVIKPEEAIKAARALRLRVYTIGIGSTGNAPFLVNDMFGRKTIQYGPVHLDEALLGRIAEETGGQYFNVKDPRGLERALNDIDKLEKTKIDTTIYNQYDEWFAGFLLPGLGLIVLGSGLNLWLRRIVA